jgi:DNA-binding response OmpR family regulator
MPGARILVVDDEPAIRLLCRVNLEAEGFQVKEAADGAAAVSIAREWLPDLILLDVMMPGEDGFAVAERIRDDSALAGVRVLFLTARADIGDHERSHSTGAVGHVTKPFNPSSLGDEVRAALARSPS